MKVFDPLGEQDQALFPGLNGGPDYGGASFDAKKGLLFVNSMDVGGLFRMVKRKEGSAIPYALKATKYEFFTDKDGYPCQQPPWGSLYAVDLNTGEIRWHSTLGEFDELKQRGIPKTGTPNIGGSMVTDGGLVFIAATSDRKFRAFDSDTGEEVWTASLPASGFATPATYMGKKSGRQFVVIPAGGGNKYDKVFTGKIVAFALPKGEAKNEVRRVFCARGDGSGWFWLGWRASGQLVSSALSPSPRSRVRGSRRKSCPSLLHAARGIQSQDACDGCRPSVQLLPCRG